MDHEALEAELKRVEARARARRKRFEAALETAESEPTVLRRRHQVRLVAIIAILSVLLLGLNLRQAFSAKSRTPASAGPPGASEEADTSAAGMASGKGGSAVRRGARGGEDAKDTIEDLFSRIQDRKYDAPGDVAVGPFLRNFAIQVRKVEAVDLTKLRPHKRGLGWTVVLAPLRVSEDPWDRPKPAARLEVRCVKSNGPWKIEQLVSVQEAGT